VSLDRNISFVEVDKFPGIFAYLAHLDFAQTALVIDYIDCAYAEIKQQGYQEGLGDRELLKKIIIAEEQNGHALTRQAIMLLGWALDIFETHEATMSPGEHESRYFLVSMYQMVAVGLLDVRESLDQACQVNMELCKSYAGNEEYGLDFFSKSLSRYMADVLLSQNSSLLEKAEILADLAYGMAILKLLIDQIISLEKACLSKKERVLILPVNVVLRDLRENILFCAKEAIEGNPEPEKWFYFLWTHIEVQAQKCLKEKVKVQSSFFSPQLSVLMDKFILNQPKLQIHAVYCLKNRMAQLRLNVEEQSSVTLRLTGVGGAT
jgi:hypothetical protein